jgi:methionyl-tRNA formyltransferase
VKIVFMGSGAFGLPTLEVMRAGPHQLVGLVCQPDRPAGRGRRLQPPPPKQLALDWGIPVLQPQDINTDADMAVVLGLGADLGVVAAFGQMLGPRLLNEIPLGCINLHASLLPRWRGAAPINWAIMAGDAVTGVTVFQLAERMDAGDILLTRQTPIGPLETAAELHDRLAKLGAEALMEALASYGDPPRRPPGKSQDRSRVTRAPKLRKEDGRLDFNQPAEQLARRVRGLWSWPGAHCLFHSAKRDADEPVLLARALFIADSPPAGCSPGTILPNGRVATGKGLLEVLELKPAGGRLMSWQDFANGRQIGQGDCFANG